MRIGTASFNDAQLNAMNSLSTQMAADQGAISTGQRRTVASDDPASAARSAALARTQADNARYSAGLDLADQRLDIMDKSLGGISNALIRLKELALLASNGTAGTADHRILLTEAQQIQKSMVSLGNAQDASGAYLFAGARASAPAFAQDAATGAVSYQGLGEAASVAVSATATIVTADAAPKIFGAIAGASAARSSRSSRTSSQRCKLPNPRPAIPLARLRSRLLSPSRSTVSEPPSIAWPPPAPISARA